MISAINSANSRLVVVVMLDSICRRATDVLRVLAVLAEAALLRPAAANAALPAGAERVLADALATFLAGVFF